MSLLLLSSLRNSGMHSEVCFCKRHTCAHATQDPPGTWEKHMSEEHNTPFYFNPATKESVYQTPTSCAWIKTYIDGNAAYTNTITHQSRWMVPKALAWKHLHELETNSCAPSRHFCACQRMMQQ